MNKVAYSPYILSILLLIVFTLASCDHKLSISPQQAIQNDSIPITQSRSPVVQEIVNHEEQLIRSIEQAPHGTFIVQALAASSRSFLNLSSHCAELTDTDMVGLVFHPSFASVTHLSLYKQKLNNTSIEILAEALKSSNLEQCPAINQSKSPRINRLAACFNKAKSQRFSLLNCRIGNSDQKFLTHTPNDLEKLDLSCNPIGNAGMMVLAPAIGGLINLKFLFLENAQIGNKGIGMLALKNLKKLEFLVLNNNKISNKGLLALLPELPISLRHFELGHNRIGNDSMKDFAIRLQALKYVSVVKMNNNQIEDDGIKELISHLQKLPELASFDLSKNKISAPVKQQLKEKVEAVGMKSYILYLD